MKEKIKEWFEDLKWNIIWFFTDTSEDFWAKILLLMLFFPMLGFIPKINTKIIFYLYILIVIPYFNCIFKSDFFISEIKEKFDTFLPAFPRFLGAFCALIIHLAIPTCMLCGLYQKSYPSEYQYQQSYIYAFPNADYAKNYRLKANVDYDSETGYQVSKIYFDKGGSIEFNSCEDGNKKGNLFYCVSDNDERDWAFRYYGEKVQKTNTK